MGILAHLDLVVEVGSQTLAEFFGKVTGPQRVRLTRMVMEFESVGTTARREVAQQTFQGFGEGDSGHDASDLEGVCDKAGSSASPRIRPFLQHR